MNLMAGQAKSGHIESVLLYYYQARCMAATKPADLRHWSGERPEYQTIWIDCVGQQTSKTGAWFRVDGILPQTPMPKMNETERAAFLRALQAQLTKQMKVRISGVTSDIVHWEGEE